MMRQIVMVNWRYIGDAVPAFVTVMFIPFGYSAAYGLIAGLMTYTALNGLIYITKLVSGGRIVPEDEDHREYWTSKSLAVLLVPPHRADNCLFSSQTPRQTALVHHCDTKTRLASPSPRQLRQGQR
jgi:hypothetical protein